MPVLPRLNVNCETKPVTLTRYIECRSYNMATRRNRRFIFCSAKLGIPGRNWVDKRTKKVEAYNSESSMVFTHLITGAWIRCLLWYQTYDYHLCSLDSGKKKTRILPFLNQMRYSVSGFHTFTQDSTSGRQEWPLILLWNVLLSQYELLLLSLICPFVAGLGIARIEQQRYRIVHE